MSRGKHDMIAMSSPPGADTTIHAPLIALDESFGVPRFRPKTNNRERVPERRQRIPK